MAILTDVAVVAALAGAAVVAAAGELRHYVELRRDRRKALNRVLWCQLDLWYELKRFDVGSALEIMAPAIAQRFGIPESEQLSLATVEAAGEAMAETFLNTREPELDQKYASAVEELAFFEPVLAHKLSGRTALQHYRDQTDTYMNVMATRIGGETPDSDVISRFTKFMRGEVLRSSLDIMTKDIDSVARRLDRPTRRQLKSAMRDFRERVNDNSERMDLVGQRFVGWIEGEAKRAHGAA